MRLQLLFFTVIHLRLEQILARIAFRLFRPAPNCRMLPVRHAANEIRFHSHKKPSMVSATTATFINHTADIGSPQCWNDGSFDKLWLYNLHYFDDCNAEGFEKRSAWHEDLIARWINENPVGKGIGWDPYPTSLRIVNWIKRHLNGNPLSPAALNSLAVQARFMRLRIEYHLLANHLFADAKALVFAGLFFEGNEAEGWLKKGLSILKKELPEQILADGGHFERSPMYHSIILEDMLDLINIVRYYGHSSVSVKMIGEWKAIVNKMLRWLRAMCHEDGKIALFNDAAFGIAPETGRLLEYARSLQIDPAIEIMDELTDLSYSGYIRMKKGKCLLIIDAGDIGPDYQPGHAHADTLSFELSRGPDRIIVDSGTSCYGTSPERHRQRGTAAHNTITVDRRNSSEVWGGFRVARRAKIVERAVSASNRQVVITAAHNGFKRLPGVGIHRRTWIIDEEKIIIEDYIAGSGMHHIEAFFHFHPDMPPGFSEDGSIIISKKGMRRIKIICSRLLDGKIEDSTYHPEFGMAIKSSKLVCSADTPLPASFTTTIET
ncbi:MAG: alginate lyase family protein [Chitinispirillaceae bacterium]|nr:alginate lyase family protein [Chitinispirillaceae bacterium]